MPKPHEISVTLEDVRSFDFQMRRRMPPDAHALSAAQLAKAPVERGITIVVGRLVVRTAEMLYTMENVTLGAAIEVLE